MSEKCRNNKHNNNNFDNPLTSRRTDGGKNAPQLIRFSLHVITWQAGLTNDDRLKFVSFIRIVEI